MGPPQLIACLVILDQFMIQLPKLALLFVTPAAKLVMETLIKTVCLAITGSFMILLPKLVVQIIMIQGLEIVEPVIHRVLLAMEVPQKIV
jgi:hypothetical protein